MGNLFVLEGSDCSGKSTQFALLTKALEDKKVKHNTITFPRYQKDSSMLVRMYLSGQFGNSPCDVNAYASSSFFAVDRFASYKTEWGKEYHEGNLILADRYTTSNAIHQASKLDGKECEDYLNWLFDFEYNLMGLPAPNLVIFLDMPTEFAVELMKNREDTTRDIHEMDTDYLKKCYKTATNICDNYNWYRVSCVKNGSLRTIEDIHEEILDLVMRKL